MIENLKRRKINKFVNDISKNIDIIKKYYRKIQRNYNYDAIWLSDNYHLFFKAFKSLETTFTKNKSLPEGTGKRPRVYDIALDYISMNSDVFTSKSFENYLLKTSYDKELQYDEIEILPDVLKYCYIEIAACAVKKEEDIDFFSVVSSIRALSDYSYFSFSEKIYPCTDMLEKNSCYNNLDEESKLLYRKLINKNSKKEKITERDYIQHLINKSAGKDISFLLFNKKKNYYFVFFAALFCILTILYSITVKNIFIIIFSIVPLYYLSKIISEKFYSLIKKGEYVPSVTPNLKTEKNLITTVTLISDFSTIDKLVEKTERCRLSNYDSNFLYGILADLPASDKEHNDSDIEFCDYIKRKIDYLNKKYDGEFFVAIRKKTYNNESKKYCGWERKRGALNNFVSAIKEKDFSSFIVSEGLLENAKYITVLDDDTLPEIDSVRRLVGVLMHPVHKPRLNSDGNALQSGYGAAIPRLDIRLSSSQKTHFVSMKGIDSGKELYSNSYFSVYQDLFGEGSFAGKGVIDIDIFYKVICGLFPENRVLSHDIPEGNILRCIYVSDVSFYDDIPLDIISFSERENRWTRGDIQNWFFLKHNIINEKHKSVLNPTGALGKYKIFNNIVESLFYPSVFILIVLSAFFGPILLVSALIFFFFEDIMLALLKLFRPVDLVKLRYRSSKFSLGTVMLLDKFYSFICLPFLAFNKFIAVITAIYRIKTKKNLLKWTTASNLGGKNRKFLSYLKKMWPQYTGVFLLFSPFLSVVGLLWLSSFFISYILAKTPKKQMNIISEKERISEMKKMWSYFDTFVTADNYYLPPDNFQEEPTAMLAKRTSPTNIGLYLVSLLGAYYMNIVDYDVFKDKLEKTTNTIKRMKKWNGHLYNWYSTSDLQVLRPEFVSTVDNGNFICSLITLRNGLKKIDGVRSIIQDLDDIISGTDFSLLYSSKKSLFSIGFDCEKNKLVNSFYDIYASESLLTYYYALTERQIPLKAWEKLNRYRYINHGYSCIKSWSGTMFEYFMPCLFMPVVKKSFNEEMLYGTFYEQENRNKKSIWGNSESSYYSFDKALNYQYKAFGVQNLAIQRGISRNNVVSPYSSWLTLPFFPDKSSKNLNRFRDIKAFGQYGYYDAVDMTPTRTGDSYAVIKNYMAHHIGMSFISGVNYLKEGVIVKNFMDEKRLAFSTLLEEKNVSYDRSCTIYPEFNPQKNKSYSKEEEYVILNPKYPVAKIISNGNLSSCLSDSGNGYLSVGDKALTKRSVNTSTPMGTFAFFNCKSDFLSASFSPVYDDKTEYKTTYEYGKMTYFAALKDLESKYSVTVSCENYCEIREYEIKNNSVKNKDGKGLFYLEPILCDYHSYNNHPAFSGLFLRGYIDNKTGNIFVCRRNRETGKDEDWIAISLREKKGANYEKTQFEVDFSRYNVLPRGKGILGIKESFSRNFTPDGIPASFCVAIRFPIRLKAKESASFTLLTAYGNTMESAASELQKASEKNFEKHAAALKARTTAVMDRLSIKRMESKLMDIMYSSVFVKSSLSNRNLSYSSSLRENSLWKYGISLQKPIIVIRVSERSKEKLRPFINVLVAIRTFTRDFNAVICFYENGRYDRPLYNYIIDKLILVDGEKYLNDGIVVCNTENFDEFALLASSASFYINLERNYKYDVKYKKYKNRKFKDVTPVSLKYKYKCGVGGYIEHNGEICYGIDDKDSVPSRTLWSHILANKNFGTVIQENSLGFTYAKNSGLNKITTWSNDSVGGCVGERLWATIDGEIFNVTEKATVVFGHGWTSYFGEASSVGIRVDVFVPLNGSEKIVRVIFDNPEKKNVSFEYSVDPILSENEKFSDVRSECEKNYIIFSNNFNPDYSGFAYLCVNYGYSGKNYVKTSIFSAVDGEAIFSLGYADSLSEARLFAEKISSLSVDEEISKIKKYWTDINHLNLNTPDEKLNMFFNFVEYQAVVSRLFARCGFYQCGGAVGFRDQLQDALCLSQFEPDFLKERIFAAASRQFSEGDVLHWWHDIEKDGSLYVKGSRTKSSDDLLWLPYSVGIYYENTLDIDFLKTSVPYAEGERLVGNETEKYISVFVSSTEDNIYYHAKKAILKGATFGEHGLVLFGSGDWNDGMTNVGAGGKGESVWCTMFLISVMKKFLPVAIAFEDSDFVDFINLNIKKYSDSLENYCWDGEWYIRGFYDDGASLGSVSCDECKIDVIPQAFSVFTGEAPSEKIEKALKSAEKYLVDDNKKIVKLFSPPFDNSSRNPGYIKGYSPGVRENGGQYTHAAIWYMLSLLIFGKNDSAYKISEYINPISHSLSSEDVKLYKIEPYVIAGDVYANGMGGWSFYTGSAAWYFRVITEYLLGIKISNKKLVLEPRIPSYWDGYSANVFYDGADLNIIIKRKKGEKSRLIVDGEEKEHVSLDGKNHSIEYTIGD